MKSRLLTSLLALLLCWGCARAQEAELSGELKLWHKITLTFDGPATSEQAEENPFTDYRLNVTFRQGARTVTVPGYYAADGDAGQSGADAGGKWRVHFAPDGEGSWTWTAEFRKGPMVAVSEEAGAGESAGFDGASGSFEVGASDKSGRDFRGKGWLEYTGGRYLQFAGDESFFVKAGADAPEVFLAYKDFDGTYQHDGGDKFLKDWAPHVKDWQEGDPTWGDGKGKGIIGALNYLASKGVNAFSFLTMNTEGDGKNVWPWTGDHEFQRFDCSKLDQWEMVFAHAQANGLYLHFKTQETENNHLLDGGDLGDNRKLYYRELIARFGHHLALNWNLGEENTQSTAQQKEMAAYFHRTDPYQNHIVIHTHPGRQEEIYRPLLGAASKLTGISLQTNFKQVHELTKTWIDKSSSSGKPWVVANDEQGHFSTGVTPMASYPGMDGRPDNHDDIRQHVLWGNLMAGGAGVEYYFGYQYPESDLTCNDLRSRDKMWDYSRYAIEFFQNEIPFPGMLSADDLTKRKDDFCFANPGTAYAIYLPDLSKDPGLTLQPRKALYEVFWYNPRTGQKVQGTLKRVNGNDKKITLGQPNYKDVDGDWVVFLK